MSHLFSGIFRPIAKPKPLSFLTTLYCPNCGQLFAASRIGRPCVYCASESTHPATEWPAEQLQRIRERQARKLEIAAQEHEKEIA